MRIGVGHIGLKSAGLPTAGAVLWSLDWANGADSTVAYTRASSATTIHPIVATPAASGYSTNAARIVATTTGKTGLFLEGAATNGHASDTPWDAATWTGTPLAGSSTTQDAVTLDPAGVAGCALHAVLSGGYGRYDTASNYFAADILGQPITVHHWTKGAAGATYASNAYDGALGHGATASLTGAWDHQVATYIAAGRVRSVVVADGRDTGTVSGTATGGGAAAGARNYRSAYHMVQTGPRASSWVAPGTTRAGSQCQIADLTAVVVAGRLCLEMSWVAPYESGRLPWSPRIWTIDSSNYAEIDQDTRCIRVVIGGTASWVSAPITWARGDIIALRLDVGNGPTLGSIRVGTGRNALIHDGRTLGSLPSSGVLDIACAGTSLQLEGVHIRWRAYDRSPGAGTIEVTTVSELVAAVAAARQRTRILLHAGTYRLTSTLAITSANNGVAIAPYPGASASIDGGEVISGAWTGPDVNGVYSIAYSGHTRQLWVNGTRATRARSSLSPAGWTATANGFTAPDAGEAAKVGLDGELVGKVLWRHFRVGVSSIVGTAITARAADWANAQSMGASFDFDAIWWVEGKGYVGDAEGHFWHDRGASMLYYRPRSGEVMGTVEVVAGVLETAVSITGTLAAPACDISISGIAVRHTTWTDPDTDGASTLQSSIVWTSGATADGYTKLPAAILVSEAQRICITACTIAGHGADAVSLEYGTQDSAVSDCSISDVAGCAVSVGDATHFDEDPRPSDARAVLARNAVANNLIRTVAQDYHGSDAIFAAYASGLVVARNDIDDTPYTAIAVGWGWGYNDPPGYLSYGWPQGVQPAPTVDTVLGNNRVMRNKITSFLRKLDDGGAIYTLAKSNGGRSVIAYNHIVSSVGSGVNQAGIYLDNGSNGWDVRANVSETVQGTYAKTQGSVTPYATGNTLIGNYATTGAYSGASGNTLGANTVGALGAAALALKAAAGRI